MSSNVEVLVEEGQAKVVATNPNNFLHLPLLSALQGGDCLDVE